jgi:nitrate/nitrite-specific signal transduction histidine kinase
MQWRNILATTSLNAEQLRDAFKVFNQQSGLLEESYRDLQDTVEALTIQLRREQSARLRELVKKERLGRSPAKQPGERAVESAPDRLFVGRDRQTRSA